VLIVWVLTPLCLFILLESFIFLAPEIYTEIAFWLNNNKDYKIEVILIIVAGFLFSILDIIVAVLRNAKSATFSMMVNDCLPYLFFLIACLWIKISSAEMIMLAFIGALLLCCMLALLFSFSYLKARRHLLRDKEKASRQYLTFWGGSILGALLAQSDVLLARYFVDGTTLGFYAILRRISNLNSLQQVIVNWSINVEVAKKFASADKFALQESATKGVMIAVAVALLMFIGIGIRTSLWLPFFDVELNVTVFGILITLMFAQLVNVMSGANLLFANQCKEEYFVLKSRIFALVLSYIAIPFFAWYWGGLGLAFGCAIPMIILNLMVTYRVRKNIGVWTSVPILQIGK
jgi:O-antigen/teichoic acid export membrane protein